MNKIFNHPIGLGTAGVIAAGATENRIGLDLKCYSNLGKASVQIMVTGDGILDLTYQVSNDGLTYQDPDEPALFTDFTKTSGPGEDGKSKVVHFTPHLCRFLRLKGVETGAANTVTVTGALCTQ